MNGDMTIIRSCAWQMPDQPVGTCPTTSSSQQVRVLFCETCETDACNGGHAITMNPVLAALSTVALVFSLAKFRWASWSMARSSDPFFGTSVRQINYSKWYTIWLYKFNRKYMRNVTKLVNIFFFFTFIKVKNYMMYKFNIDFFFFIYLSIRSQYWMLWSFTFGNV